MRKLWTISLSICLLALVLYACGGGGGNNDTPTTPPSPDYTGGVHYGYWWTDGGNQLAETYSHVDIIFETFGLANYPIVASHLSFARANFLTVILALEVYKQNGNNWYCDTNPTRLLLDSIRRDGYLDLITGVYPIDEPDLAKIPDQLIIECNSNLRSLFSNYPGLTPKFIVVYSDNGYPGISSYDWVGRDNYGRGIQVDVPITGTQRRVLLPGGANPWRESPQTTIDYAKAHPSEVALVLPFLWTDYSEPGIGHNGMGREYCLAGRAITLKQGVC